jgi:hypothetical protein
MPGFSQNNVEVFTRNGIQYPAGANGRLLLGDRMSREYLRVSYLGDSISSRDIPTTASGLNGPRADGMGFIAQMLSMGRLRLHTTRAVGGYTIEQIATLVPQIIADAPDRCVVLAGTNNTYGAVTPDPAATIFAALRNLILTPLLNAGIEVEVCTLPASASRSSTITAVQHAAAKQLNQLIRALNGTNPGLIVTDLCTVTEAASGANEGTDISLYVATEATYLHPNDSGSMAMAAERWRISQMRGLAAHNPEVEALSSPYSLAANPRGNGNNATGTNKFTLGTGVTGTGPDGWNITRTGTSTAVVTPGAVARDDGRTGQLIQVAATIVGAGEIINVFPVPGGAQYISGVSTSVHLRANLAAYVEGEIRKFTNSLYYKVVQPGTSAASEPGTLPTSIGGMVTDGTVIWMKIPELVPGVWIRGIAELYFSAHAIGNVYALCQIRQYTAAFASLAAGIVFEMDGTTYTAGNAAASWSVVQAPCGTGFNGYKVGLLPLNKPLRLQTAWMQIAPDCGIIEPSLRIIGAAGATATVQISQLDWQIRA